jgi:hypothetical protein
MIIFLNLKLLLALRALGGLSAARASFAALLDLLSKAAEDRMRQKDFPDNLCDGIQVLPELTQILSESRHRAF